MGTNTETIEVTMTWRSIISLAAVTGLLILGAGLFALQPTDSSQPPDSPGQLPSYATQSEEVEAAYKLAVSNQDALQYIPCYCGCAGMGHTSNKDCYLDGDGYAKHASYCQHCRSITNDAVAMLENGKDLKAVRNRIEAKYGKYGKGTPTPPVPT